MPLPRLPAFRRSHRTLDLYMGKRFLGLFLADCFVFTLVYVLIDSLAQIEDFLEHSEGFLSFLKVGFVYYYYTLPELFCRLLGPAITMASAMFAVTLTARANEFVPILATGTSIQRCLLPILILSAGLTGGTFALQEYWIPSHRNEIRAAKAYGRGHEMIRHAHHSDRERGVVVMVREYYPYEQRAQGVLVFSTGQDRETNFLINATSARWFQPVGEPEGHWVLEDGELEEYRKVQLIHKTAPGNGGEESSTALSEPFERRRLVETVMIPQDLEEEESQDHLLWRSELLRKVQASPDQHRWRIKYYSRLVDPLHHIILLLLGVPIILFRNFRNVFLTALASVVVATGYFVLHAVCIYLGNRGTLDPATASWFAPILFSCLGMTFFISLRT